MPIPLADYATFARSQFMNLPPGDATRGYANGWRGVLHDIYRAGGNAASPGGLFEVTSIVVSRWEFLGALYAGETQHDTKARHAALYAKRFLPQYANVHNLSGDPNCQTDCSEFFGMLRNKPLHGFSPAGVLTHNQPTVTAWGIGSCPGQHLQIGAAGVFVDCLTLVDDLCASMMTFADVLDANTEAVIVGPNTKILPDPHPPQERWQRAFWARFCPIREPLADWMTLGTTTYGIPP